MSTSSPRYPYVNVHVGTSPIASAARSGLSTLHYGGSARALESDKGGEAQGRKIDTLVEHLIPRFTEIKDLDEDLASDVGSVRSNLTGPPSSLLHHHPTSTASNRVERGTTSRADTQILTDLNKLDLVDDSQRQASTSPPSGARGKGKAPTTLEDEDWLMSIDRELANGDTRSDIQQSPSEDYSTAAGRTETFARHSPSKPATMSIKGRASELSPTSRRTSPTIFRQPTESERPRQQPDISGLSRNGGEYFHAEGNHRHTSPLSAQSTSSGRPASTPASYLSANDSSQASGSNSRVTLGAAAAEWRFDQPAGGSWPKPIRRDQTIEPHHSRFQGPSVMRLGTLSQSYSTIDGARRNIPQNHHMQGIKRTQPPTRHAYSPNLSHQNGYRPGSRLNLPEARRPDPLGNVEIRIMNIPQGSSKDELYALLCDAALHRAPFSTRDKKLNFWLHLPRPKAQVGDWGQTNEGHAFLTLPSAELVNRFIAKYGRGASSGISIRASGSRQALQFERGNRVPPAGILEWLNRVPYPEKGDRSQRVINDRKADNLALLRIEFGVFCRDGVFSPEYVKDMRGAKFSFDYRHKNFRISYLMDTAAGQTPSTRLLVVKSSAIRLVLSSVEDDEFSATLIMSHPPAYEQLLSRSLDPDDEEEEYTESGKKTVLPRRYTGRQRRPGWDHGHQKTAGYTSRTIRLVFETESLRNDLEDLLLAIGGPHARYVRLETENRRLYSSSRRKAIQEWLSEVPSRAVAFQLACLYHNNLLVPSDLLALRPGVEELYSRKGGFVTADVLHQYVEELTRLQERWYERILQDRRKEDEKDLDQNLDPSLVLKEFITRGISRVNWREQYQSTIMQCLHVVLTPTSLILEGPYPDQSNRPLRKYGHHDHFIRVAFMDEDKQPYFWGPDIDWTAFLDERVGAILREGITLGGKRYDFLGYSMSSLRNRSTWFCTPFEWENQIVDAPYIRAHLGDFEKVKRQPARYGARMAQAFTATDPSVILRPEEIEKIDDVVAMWRGEEVCFTDGVGKISLSLTKKVWTALHNGMEPVGILPSAFQFRLGGYKGVFTVDSTLEGDKVCVRPSQQKFDAPDSLGLEVAYTYTTYMPMFLNRPLIKVLEDLEVPEEAFLSLLKEAVRSAEDMKDKIRETRRQLTLHGLGGPFGVTDLVENIGALLRTNRIEPFKESGRLATFIADSLEFAEVHILRLLKLKARIPVPMAHVGVAVADESGTLREGEIYAMRQNPGQTALAVEGDVLLVRAPTVDVGDVQYARAVGRPPPGAERFHHLPNVVIFSIHGAKPLLSQLSRGDMDGDLVGVIYDKRLYPKRTEPAMQHQPKKPVDLPYDCTINEVIDFVLRFFRNDILGMIANRHLLIADQAPRGFEVGCGTRHPACKKLAELQTVAVDAPKSGQSVDLAEMPRPLFPHRPDFMTHEQLLVNSEPDEESLIYHSNNILGKLYRAISLTSQEMDNQVPKEAEPLDPHYIPAGEDDHILLAISEELEKCGLDVSRQPSDEEDRKDAWFAMHSFASDLRHVAWSNTMNSGHPLAEHELFIGTILHGPLATKLKQEMTQRVNLQCKELIDAMLTRLEGHDGRDRPQHWTNRILAAMRVAVSQMGNFGAATFACIALRSCLYLLALMRDVHKAHVFAAGYEPEEEPFQPVLTNDASQGQVDLSAAGDLMEGSMGKLGNGADFVPLQGDEGGEATPWTIVQ